MGKIVEMRLETEVLAFAVDTERKRWMRCSCRRRKVWRSFAVAAAVVVVATVGFSWLAVAWLGAWPYLRSCKIRTCGLARVTDSGGEQQIVCTALVGRRLPPRTSLR